jgi:hypothetical protein
MDNTWCKRTMDCLLDQTLRMHLVEKELVVKLQDDARGHVASCDFEA